MEEGDAPNSSSGSCGCAQLASRAREQFGDISRGAGCNIPKFGVVGIDSWPSGTGRGPWNEGDLGHSRQPSKQAVVCSRNGSSTPGEGQGACVGLACAQHPQASSEAEGACQVSSSFLDVTSMPALR